MSIVQLKDLSKHYGSVRALDNLTLELEAGAPIALVGPNGAGKTTLISVLCGFIRATSGSVKLLGEEPGSAALVGKLSAMPQDALMDPGFSVQSQLVFYSKLQGFDNKAAQVEASRVLDIVKLTDAGGKNPGELSHGMRKRVSLAQALIGDPDLIFLDEPTAGIDPPNVKIIRDLISELAAQATFVVSSHNLDELEKLCSTVVYLENGRLTHSGSIESDDTDSYLTVRLVDVPVEEFRQAALQIAGVESIDVRAQGEFVLTSAADADIELPLLTLLKERGWKYRQLNRGRTLEDRLYGQ